MMIGGNIEAMIQIRSTTKNEIGEAVERWADVQMITGWLDFEGEQTGRTNYSTKLQESTHIFIADYQELDGRIKTENSRMVISGKTYDIMLIDDPMKLHRQLEIFLKFTGGQ